MGKRRAFDKKPPERLQHAQEFIGAAKLMQPLNLLADEHWQFRRWLPAQERLANQYFSARIQIDAAPTPPIGRFGGRREGVSYWELEALGHGHPRALSERQLRSA